MSKPNILFILVDQFRPDAIGPHTPNLNKLARRGVKFEHCYSASPLCQPARNCIITGRYPTQHGVCGNMNEPIDQDERADTFMQHLKRQGYHTALIGKHHYIDRFDLAVDALQDDETLQGYGLDFVWQAGDQPSEMHDDDRYTRYLRERGLFDELRRIAMLKGVPDKKYPLAPKDSIDGYIGEQSIAYIQNHAFDVPLYLNVGFVGPHPPYWAPGEYSAMFDPAQMPAPKGVTDPERIAYCQRIRASYLGKVALIDHYIGRLCEALKDKGVLDDTLIVFSSDHGDNLGDYGIWNKRHFYEQSAGVPLVMAGPGVSMNPRLGGSICKALVSQIDLYPTFLQAARCENIYGVHKRQGRPLLDLTSGGEPFRDAVFSELGTASMVRDANWKLVYDPEQGGVQHLYNLRNDPQELTNLAGVAGYREIEAGLLERLLTHFIGLTHFTHDKERTGLQRVRVSSTG
jgi:arylsulfatase A-like enzyme